MFKNTKSMSLISFVLFLVSICVVKATITADIGSKRYVIATDKSVNWYMANHACTAQGMSLASIETEDEYNSLRRYLLDKDQSLNGYWLSGSNLANKNTYTWLSSGNKLSYTKWASGSSTEESQCILTDSLFKWKTDACATALNSYICSRSLIPYCGITGRCKITRSFYF